MKRFRTKRSVMQKMDKNRELFTFPLAVDAADSGRGKPYLWPMVAWGSKPMVAWGSKEGSCSLSSTSRTR